VPGGDNATSRGARGHCAPALHPAPCETPPNEVHCPPPPGLPRPGLAQPKAGPGLVGIPCQNSNNGDKPALPGGETRPENILKGNHRRTAFALAENVRAFVDRNGLARCGFLTLTFADHVTDPREASRRFHSLSRRVLGHRYRGPDGTAQWIRILERQKSGRIHYHLLVNVGSDIRTGFDFQAYCLSRQLKRDYSHVKGVAETSVPKFRQGYWQSASRALRSEWAFWRKTAPAYGFGRTEIIPLRSCDVAVSLYLGKYVSKHIGQRKLEDKSVKLVGYSPDASRCSVRFGWVSENATLWRQHLETLAHHLGIEDIGGFPKFLGKGWCLRVMDLKFKSECNGEGKGLTVTEQAELLRSESFRRLGRSHPERKRVVRRRVSTFPNGPGRRL